jgi:hypothetical protein
MRLIAQDGVSLGQHASTTRNTEARRVFEGEAPRRVVPSTTKEGATNNGNS